MAEPQISYQGIVGATGPAGPPGTNGTNGTNGNTVLTGTGAPSNGLGVNGDSYIDTVAEKIYTPKAAGVWPAGVSLIGPAGTAGATGATGPAGPGTGSQISPAVGVITLPRAVAGGASGAFNPGFGIMTGFVPQVSFAAGNLTMFTVATVALTHAYMALYSIDASGNATQIAITADTPTIGTSGRHKVPLVSPVALTAGSAYAVYLLNVGASINYLGPQNSTSALVAGSVVQPYSVGFVTAGGLTTPPGTVAVGAVTFHTFPMYAEITV